jgi:hypothetical protein
MGDLFMSLIHACELNGVTPFDYLIELPRHAGELKRVPFGMDALELSRYPGTLIQRPRNMMNLAWPKWIAGGHGRVTS